MNNEELHNMYSAKKSIIIFSKQRRERCAEHLGSTGETINAYKIFVGNVQEKKNFVCLAVDGRVILIWTLEKN
jgi:hypothetical protein